MGVAFRAFLIVKKPILHKAQATVPSRVPPRPREAAGVGGLGTLPGRLDGADCPTPSRCVGRAHSRRGWPAPLRRRFRAAERARRHRPRDPWHSNLGEQLLSYLETTWPPWDDIALLWPRSPNSPLQWRWEGVEQSASPLKGLGGVFVLEIFTCFFSSLQ